MKSHLWRISWPHSTSSLVQSDKSSADKTLVRNSRSSASGDFDLMMKLYVPTGEDIGMFINDRLLSIDGIERTFTIQTFKAF